MYLWSLKDEQYLNSHDYKQCTVIQGSDSLFMDNKNISYWVNLDQTAFYVFTLMQGAPEAQWVRGTRDNRNLKMFEAGYVAKIKYAADTVNSYKITNGIYLDVGGSEKQAH